LRSRPLHGFPLLVSAIGFVADQSLLDPLSLDEYLLLLPWRRLRSTMKKVST